MRKYIFLDNWVYSLLRDAETTHRLAEFVSVNDYTVPLTSLSMVELYNPRWESAGDKDRVYKAVHFLSQVPCVIVNPRKVYDAEITSYLSPLQVLPVELDLHDLPDELRASTLLRFFRRDELFLKQGIDIQSWSDNYKQIKKDWLTDVENIIEQACKDGNLKRDKNARFVELKDYKEQFLFSLDFRHADSKDVDAVLVKLVERAKAGQPTHLTAV
jgi:hypothetical protein